VPWLSPSNEKRDLIDKLRELQLAGRAALLDRQPDRQDTGRASL
jgi:hypothetical protein